LADLVAQAISLRHEVSRELHAAITGPLGKTPSAIREIHELTTPSVTSSPTPNAPPAFTPIASQDLDLYPFPHTRLERSFFDQVDRPSE